MTEIDYKVRALYYMYLVGGPWKFYNTIDPKTWEYIREISGIVYDGIGSEGVDKYMVHIDGKQMADLIIRDLQYD